MTTTQKINIEKLSDVKIKKIRKDSIRFSNKGCEYVIVSAIPGSEYVPVAKLFKAERNGKGDFDLQDTGLYHHGIYTRAFIRDYLSKTAWKSRQPNCGNVDVEYFVKMLVECGFSNGLYEKQFCDMSEELSQIEEEISKLEKKMSDVYAKWTTTNRKGSKFAERDKLPGIWAKKEEQENNILEER